MQKAKVTTSTSKVFDVADFNRRYRGTKQFSQKSILFQQFLRDVTDLTLMEKIRFANDIAHIPPVYSYLVYRENMLQAPLQRDEKKNIGKCFGYLYQYGFYASLYGEDSKTNVRAAHAKSGLTTASWFQPKLGQHVLLSLEGIVPYVQVDDDGEL